MDFNVRPIGQNEVGKFIGCARKFYENEKYWVAPLKMDMKKTLDVNKNPFFKHSDMQMFLAESGNEIVGRIAAITNDNHNKTHNDKVGFFGFFECVNDPKVADALFKAAADWLKGKGMNAMRGPENPSMNDVIGFLAKGFDSIPLIMNPYNPKYYLDLTENAGFRKAKDLYAFKVDNNFASEKLLRLQDILRKRNKITIREIDFKNKAQFKKDVDTLKYIYNAAWEPNWGFVKWTDEEFDYIAEDLKMVADPRLAFIAEVKGEPAGFGLALPNINEVLRDHRSGGTLGALWRLIFRKKQIEWMRIIALGVVPKFQNTGVDSVMYVELGQRALNSGKKYGEASWVLEDNDMMIKGLTKTMNGENYKTYRLYEKKI